MDENTLRYFYSLFRRLQTLGQVGEVTKFIHTMNSPTIRLIVQWVHIWYIVPIMHLIADHPSFSVLMLAERRSEEHLLVESPHLNILPLYVQMCPSLSIYEWEEYAACVFNCLALHFFKNVLCISRSWINDRARPEENAIALDSAVQLAGPMECAHLLQHRIGAF